MKILNLVNSNNSDIKYKISKFPDGQQNITILKYNPGIEIWGEDPNTMGSKPLLNKQVQIKSKLNNFLDLELIICAVACLREMGIKEIYLYTPYIVGARSDRKFEDGGNNYLKDVICPIINSLNFESVTCIDPHSDVLEACIKNFKKESNLELVNWSINELSNIHKHIDDIILISPDAGASKKIYKLAEQIGYKGDIITCSKDRDKDGKLIKVNVPYDYFKYGKKDLILIDDICDGGATFINIAKELQTSRTKSKIYLIVTHGIFSKGFEELSKYFDGIYCTNSYNDIKSSENYKVPDFTNDFIKQLNVF